MGFLGIGTWEILLILILAFIILGPSKLTEFARILGKTVRAIRKASTDLTTAVTRELEATQNEPPPSQPEEESRAETGEAPSAINKPNIPGQDDHPNKPGEESATK
jgi:sec-independent protein translocase protein TatA